MPAMRIEARRAAFRSAAVGEARVARLGSILGMCQNVADENLAKSMRKVGGWSPARGANQSIETIMDFLGAARSPQGALSWGAHFCARSRSPTLVREPLTRRHSRVYNSLDMLDINIRSRSVLNGSEITLRAHRRAKSTPRRSETPGP